MTKTCRNDFARWLSEHAEEMSKCRIALAEYKERASHQGLRSGGSFGHWLYSRRHKEFDKLYRNFWLKHDDLWDMVYDGVNTDEV